LGKLTVLQIQSTDKKQEKTRIITKITPFQSKLNLRTPDVIITKLNDSYQNNTVETRTGSLMTEVPWENDK